MEPEPGVDVEAGAVVVGAVAVAGKEINPTKHNWKNSCEFSREYLVFVINRVDFLPISTNSGSKITSWPAYLANSIKIKFGARNDLKKVNIYETQNHS